LKSSPSILSPNLFNLEIPSEEASVLPSLVTEIPVVKISNRPINVIAPTLTGKGSLDRMCKKSDLSLINI